MNPEETMMAQMLAMYVGIGLCVLLASRRKISSSYGFAAFFIIVFRFFMWPWFAGWKLCDFMKSGDL